MLKFGVFLWLAFPFAVNAGTTDTQAFFLGTAKTYNLNLSEKTWLKKIESKISAEDLKVLSEGLAATKDDVFLSAVAKDKTTLAFVDIEGKTLAKLTTNEAGKLFINSQPLELENLNGLVAQFEYLKAANLGGDLKAPAKAQVEMAVLKFFQNFSMGLSPKNILQLQGDNSADAVLFKDLVTPFEVKRLDHFCRLYEGEVPPYLRNKYKVGGSSEMAQVDGVYAVRSMTLHLLDEYEETYEERLDVVFKAKPQVVFTKASKSKKKASKKSSEVYVYDIWHNGQQLRKNLLANDTPSRAPEMSRARSLLTCCGSQALNGKALETDATSCLDRLRVKTSPTAVVTSSASNSVTLPPSSLTTLPPASSVDASEETPAVVTETPDDTL